MTAAQHATVHSSRRRFLAAAGGATLSLPWLETLQAVVSVAVPVFNEENKVIASVSCSTASARLSEQEMIEQIVPELRDAARDIEFQLRRSPMLAHSIMS